MSRDSEFYPTDSEAQRMAEQQCGQRNLQRVVPPTQAGQGAIGSGLRPAKVLSDFALNTITIGAEGTLIFGGYEVTVGKVLIAYGDNLQRLGA